MRRTWCGWWLALMVAGMAALAAPEEGFFGGKRDAVICRDKALPGKRCIVADMSQPGGTVFSYDLGTLVPGRYRVDVPLKLSAINSLNTAPLEWNLAVGGAGEGGRGFDILCVERAGVYQIIPCSVEVRTPGSVSLVLSWRRTAVDNKGTGVRMRVTSKDTPKLGQGLDGGDDLLGDLQLEDEPDLATVKYLYLAVAPPVMTKVGDVGVTELSVDKIRYKPGEQAAIHAVLHNYDSRPRTFTVVTGLLHGLDERIAVDSRQLEVPGSGDAALDLNGPAMTAKWGYAVEVSVRDGDKEVARRAEYFTVHDNMWAIVIAGRAPAQFTAHIDRDRAIASALDNQRRYRNWVESGFWAPDEFGDFTPDTEYWWGGQGCYYGGVTGTRVMIEEGHKRGISFAVYSNIWGGDGPPAFEMVRKHPDWGYPSTFNTEWFERWDRNTMGTGAPGPGMHVWPHTVMNSNNPEPFRHHGRELIATHKMFGWDAVRYDSHAITDRTAEMVELGREIVWKELPDFQYGYNSSVPHGLADKINAFKSECRNGGLIMEEGIRKYGEGQQSYEAFARRILDYKQEARKYGGNFLAIGMDKCYKNDLVYQYIFWLAGNTHPCYDWQGVSVANYMQFATRYAGLLWDLNVTEVSDAGKWVDAGPDGKALFWLPDYVHQRDLGGGHRQLIVHLINKPTEKRLYTNSDCKLPAPLADIPLTIRLPAGAKVTKAWWLTAEPRLTQEELAVSAAGDGIKVVVPRLRFWDTVVLDLDNCGAFE